MLETENNVLTDQKAGSQPAVGRNPAARVIARFGSAYRLAKLINRHEASIYKWTWPVWRGGTGGLVPSRAQPLLIEAAKQNGILLAYNDFAPQDGDECL